MERGDIRKKVSLKQNWSAQKKQEKKTGRRTSLQKENALRSNYITKKKQDFDSCLSC